jgi:hypothetical protein
MPEVTPSDRRRLQRLTMALVAGVLIVHPPVAISEGDVSNPARTVARASEEPLIYDVHHTTVVPPAPKVRELPPWTPTHPSSPEEFVGDLEIIIGPDGRVVSKRILDSVEAHYDVALLQSATDWIFAPARLGGVPVTYRYILTIRLLP